MHLIDCLNKYKNRLGSMTYQINDLADFLVFISEASAIIDRYHKVKDKILLKTCHAHEGLPCPVEFFHKREWYNHSCQTII